MIKKITKSCAIVLHQKPWHHVFETSKSLPVPEKIVLENAFFKRTRLANKTFKRTVINRMDDVNARINKHIKQIHGDKQFTAMDVAVSSGITSMDWYKQLEADSFNFKMVAGDAYVKAFLVSLRKNNGYNMLFDKNGYLLEFNFGNRVFKNSISYCPLNWLPYLYARLTIARHGLQNKIKALDFDNTPANATIKNFPIKPFPLVSQFFEEKSKLQFIEDDIIVDEHYQKEIDVLRACNIINLGYFSTEIIHKIIANLKKRLRPNAIFTICRTLNDESNHATIFKLNNQNKFEVLERIGDGSEVEKHVLTG